MRNQVRTGAVVKKLKGSEGDAFAFRARTVLDARTLTFINLSYSPPPTAEVSPTVPTVPTVPTSDAPEVAIRQRRCIWS